MFLHKCAVCTYKIFLHLDFVTDVLRNPNERCNSFITPSKISWNYVHKLSNSIKSTTNLRD